MLSSETQARPKDIEQERRSDLDWVGRHWRSLWFAAQRGFNEFGRGAVETDRLDPEPDLGNPIKFLPENFIEKDGVLLTAAAIVRRYDPTRQFAIIVRHGKHISSYLIGVSTLSTRMRPAGRITTMIG